MLKLIATPDAKLLSDLSEEKRTSKSVAKHTAKDEGDLRFYKSKDGKRSYLRVTETIANGNEKPVYKFTVFEILPAPVAAVTEPPILSVK